MLDKNIIKTCPGQIQYYLAVDIGASSGRHILAHMEDGKIVCEEIYRFYNGNDLLLKDGTNAGPADMTDAPEGSHRIWDLDRLFSEIIRGMKKCSEEGRIPVSMGIDTWGVDCVLLDKNDTPASAFYAYRDSRTEGMNEEVYRIIPKEELYARTGIQEALFNTIFQLTASKLKEPQTLEKAQTLLMLPDYFHFLLTGIKSHEYTNATTTGLINAASGDWDKEIITRLGLPERLFDFSEDSGPHKDGLCMPGTVLGPLREEIQKEVGFNCQVILPATHDTGSAIMSIPSVSDNTLYISSGTWSLLGCELKEPDCSDASREANFTNEGGYDRRFRFLKNIMGLWMIQSVKKEFEAADPNGDYSFGTLCEKASREKIDSIVDVNDSRFLAPVSMAKEIRSACRQTGQKVPESEWEIARVIYRSLASCYRDAMTELEAITGKHFDSVNVVGGGSNAAWLNELTAHSSGKKVLAGPGEATAIGCLGAQMIACGQFSSLKDFRKCVYSSFKIREYNA